MSSQKSAQPTNPRPSKAAAVACDQHRCAIHFIAMPLRADPESLGSTYFPLCEDEAQGDNNHVDTKQDQVFENRLNEIVRWVNGIKPACLPAHLQGIFLG